MKTKEAVDGENSSSAKDVLSLAKRTWLQDAEKICQNTKGGVRIMTCDVAECKTIGALPRACFLVMYIIYSDISIT